MFNASCNRFNTSENKGKGRNISIGRSEIYFIVKWVFIPKCFFEETPCDLLIINAFVD